MEKKICFVVMGFGKKMDYRNSKEIDLDIIYNKIIRDLFTSEIENYDLIRADELSGSELIDIKMYTLLLKADLVIADITTMNENAIYELGIRHALKPFSTIIMMQKSEKQIIPFDLNHCRILKYEEINEKMQKDQVDLIKQNLKKFVEDSEKFTVDSPFYIFLPLVKPPEVLSDIEFNKMLKEIKENKETVAKLVDEAKILKAESNFKESAAVWEKLHKISPQNEYIIQQLALAEYKSEIPNKTLALEKALETIKKLNPKQSLDLETLGITGAIYKRLFKLNNNYDYLDEAIRYYERGYIIKNDYYNGENYANCLLLKCQQENLESEENMYLKLTSKKIYKEIINILNSKLQEKEIDHWIYATLATAYLAINDKAKFKEYEQYFINSTSINWELNTYKETIKDIEKLLEK